MGMMLPLHTTRPNPQPANTRRPGTKRYPQSADPNRTLLFKDRQTKGIPWSGDLAPFGFCLTGFLLPH